MHYTEDVIINGETVSFTRFSGPVGDYPSYSPLNCEPLTPELQSWFDALAA